MNNEIAKKCGLCGDPMPDGEEMFNYHGYSGPCPKPPLKKPMMDHSAAIKSITESIQALEYLAKSVRPSGGGQQYNAQHLYRIANDMEAIRMAIIQQQVKLSRLVEIATECSEW